MKYHVGLLGGEFRVHWCKKSDVGREFPFNVHNPDIDETHKIIKNPKTIKLSTREFLKISKTLEKFSPKLLNFLNEHEIKKVFLIHTDTKILAIDRQGYDYPRYKSFVNDSMKIRKVDLSEVFSK